MRISSFLSILLVLIIIVDNVKAAMSADQIDQLLFGHNKARAEKGVAPLVWDTTIANFAQAYSDQCIWGHNANRGNYGENIAMGQTTVWEANRGWIDGEYGDWVCGTAINNNNYDHYTQVVWANTQKVGCGYTVCPNGKYYVCNYASPGNYMGQLPFPAAQCNNKVACTPRNTCTQKGGVTFTDTDCGTITCGSGGTTTGTPTTPKPTSKPTSAPTTPGPTTPKPTTKPTSKPTSAPTNPPSGGHSLYSTALQNGWVLQHNSGVTITHSNAYSGKTGLKAVLTNASPNYFIMFNHVPKVNNVYTTLKFNIAASSSGTFWIYFNSGYYVVQSVTTSWQAISIPLTNLKNPSTNAVFTSFGDPNQLVFRNAGNAGITLYLNNVVFV